MRLLTHNVLRCAIKGVEEGYPLSIEASEVQMEESPFRPDFVKHIAPTLNWPALRQAVKQVGLPEDMLPEAVSDALLGDEAFLRALHRVLMDVHVVAGALVCPESGRRFPIAHGIPDMMIAEGECPRDDK
ncbi:hypothetical protein JKP88DRAFT_162383 [Tribonema minus]|uniref:Multifunctional methyltransferase subunit TRM112-like protein n=1 Tax=Tribonema minus TaxID=303371 RepID=A0A836CHT2_9STRA|nr:hypothetical protein JKP88DRAFT_162383 [Tribonema minus]